MSSNAEQSFCRMLLVGPDGMLILVLLGSNPSKVTYGEHFGLSREIPSGSCVVSRYCTSRAPPGRCLLYRTRRLSAWGTEEVAGGGIHFNTNSQRTVCSTEACICVWVNFEDNLQTIDFGPPSLSNDNADVAEELLEGSARNSAWTFEGNDSSPPSIRCRRSKQQSRGARTGE